MRGTPAAASRFTSSARTSGASVTGWFWSPSRGPTSQIVTLMGFGVPGGSTLITSSPIYVGGRGAAAVHGLPTWARNVGEDLQPRRCPCGDIVLALCLLAHQDE